MEIVAYELEAWEREAFRSLADGNIIVFVDEPLNAEDAPKNTSAEVISTFVYSKLDADALASFPKLRLIATRSTGYDHIDLDYCRAHGVAVCNVPTYGENTVAEHVFGLLLTISHRLREAMERARSGDFSPQGLQGFDLAGKTLGVVGTGHIGRCVIEIARGFRMNVIAHDAIEDAHAAQRLGFRYVSLEDLLRESDVVTLHIPANAATHKFLNEERFALMKKDAVLINTARGGVVDVEALLKALAEGRIAAAGLDVLPEEPLIREEAQLLRSLFHHEHNLGALLADHVLLRLRNVYITPHSAFNTREAVQRILDTTVENIRAFGAGTPQNIVNPRIQ